LATARDEATQLNRHLTVLNRVFRHDLRNSANVIQGHAELLVEETNDAIGDSARTIRDQATDLVTLSEQVRDIERILQSESYERQPVDLVELISTQLDRVERDRPAVETDGPNLDRCLVSAHPLVESAIRNVVDNAVEHNDKQTPRVDVTLSQSENWVEVRIADNGPGIPDDEVAVLERGYETPLEHTNGLGLWLVSWIVRESGGEVDFQERSPRGSVVSVQFEKASQEIPTEDGTVEH
jgi:signal transduction histidine kinase